MSSHRSAVFNDTPYVDPNPLPSSVPKIDELGVTSAPLKSAAFFIGSHCREVNGGFTAHEYSELTITEDFMLCKQENRDPAHCLKEGRKVTRCAAEL
jgi:NADH dehydrogenase (ubiquinone) 1 alpha subcomplex subunit 8